MTAVASGAVLRALNKQQGPSRQAYSSFGFLRIEPYPPFKVYHTFEVDNPRLLCEEVLYVSDQATESHFALHDLRNQGEQSPPFSSTRKTS